ncbi:MAG: sulfite exporter TauE/SafE family protein [Chthoniobacterales bacterium]
MPELSQLSSAQWMLAGAAALCVGMGKAGFSGMGVLAIILMATILPAKQSTGVILPMLIFADIFAVLLYRKHAVISHVWRLIPPAFIGIVCGFFLMPLIPAEAFGKFIGWITLIISVLFLIQKASGQLEKIAAAHPAVAWPTGWAAGVTTMLANAAGPIMTVYLLACRLPKFEFVGTGAWYFFILNIVKVPFSAYRGLINGSSLLFDIAMAPCVLIGIGLARYFLGKIPQLAFDYLMLGFSILASLWLVIR